MIVFEKNWKWKQVWGEELDKNNRGITEVNEIE